MKNLFLFLFSVALWGSIYGQCPDNVNDPGIIGSGSIDVHRIECAWELSHGSPDVVVAVVDVFSSQLHEDLNGKIESITQIDPMDADWVECHHGISVAGIIAAIPNNGIACAGVGYDTKVALYNVVASCGSGSPTGGFYAAVADGHDIINLSWQGNVIPRSAAQSFIDGGGVIVTAGGDDHHTNYSDIPGVINVGRMSWNGATSAWKHSNYLDPDVDERIEIYGYAAELNRLLEFDGWGPTNNGTSAIAPLVAGTVALMKAENPSLTPAEIECIIQMSARGVVTEAPADAFAKILDVEAAVALAQSWPNIPLGDEIELAGAQTITNLTATGNVVVKTGADINVVGKITMAHEQGKIIIERGARLNVLGATVTTGTCNEEWRGFVVEGNAAKSQPNPYGTLLADDAGVLLLNNAQVFNARNAVSMHNKHQSPTLSYTGGVVIANNGTTFTDNGRSFEFMKYDLGDISTITNCFFINNSRDVITAWRDHGLQFSDNTFIDYQQDGIFNATSLFDATGNSFSGSGTLGGIDYLYTNTGININNAAIVNGNYKIEGNFFTLNHHGIKFEGTDNNLDGVPSYFLDNTLIGNDFGIFGQGSDFFHVRHNQIDSESNGIIVFNSGTSDSEVSYNSIGGFSGLVAVNQNDLFTFYRNCFQAMPNTSSANDFELIRVGSDIVSMGPLQRVFTPGGELAADNCFQNASGDMVNGGTNALNNIFAYGLDLNLPTSDCRIPRPNNMYVNDNLVSVYESCSTAPPGNPIYTTPVYCNVPNTEAELEAERDDLLDQIANLEAQSNLTFAQIHLLRKLKRCLEKVEAKLGEKLIETQSFPQLNASLAPSRSPFTRVAVVSKLVNDEEYVAAHSFMLAAPDNIDGWMDYVASQEILIRLLDDYDNFLLTGSEAVFLVDAGTKSNYFAPFIRGVYAEATGESIYLDLPEGGDDRGDDKNLNENTQPEPSGSTVLVSPNPATDLVNVSIEGQEIRQVSIVALHSGAVVKEVLVKGAKSLSMDVHDLPVGMYIILIENAAGEVFTEKWIKM